MDIKEEPKSESTYSNATNENANEDKNKKKVVHFQIGISNKI